MYKHLFIIGLLFCFASFGYFLLGLMNLEPLWTSAPLLFLSIFFTLHCYNRHRRPGKQNPSVQPGDAEKEKGRRSAALQ